MTRTLFAALAAMVWMAPGLGASDRQSEVSLKWNELGPAVTDKKVALGLPDGTYVEGKVRVVEPGGLRLRVTKTSDKKVVAKGDRLIEKSAISTIRVNNYRKIGRVIGVLAAVGGAAIAIGVNDINVNEGVGLIIIPAVAVGGTIGLGVGGYYIGKQFDKRTTIVHVVP